MLTSSANKISEPESGCPSHRRLLWLPIGQYDQMRLASTAHEPSLTGRILTGIGWLVVGALALVVGARIVAWDRWRWFADLDAAIEVLFLPAWLVLMGALFAKRWGLAVAALAICVAQVIYVAPEVLASTPLPAGLRMLPTLRLFDANVYQRNYSMAGYVRQMNSDQPDLVTLEETETWDQQQFDVSPTFKRLRYHYSEQCCGSRGFIVASRFPLGHGTISKVDGLPYMVRFKLSISGRPINLWVVHTTAPVNPNWNMWNQELDGVSRQLMADHPRPLLMVGDFNASWGNRGFRAILSTGLTDAAAARGEPFDFTWSQLLPLLPPLIRIDHVLTGGDLTVTSMSTHPGPGSEHRDITAIVAIGAHT
jgi:endonuclease/exonuclease/phosphatase (EEP) superfamily protein YafD